MTLPCRFPRHTMVGGFTLAELLIALAILGVIATFTIPKVLQAQQDSKFKSIAQEAAGMIAGAYDAHRLADSDWMNTSPTDLTPFMNYVATDTATDIDHLYNSATSTTSCAAANRGCLRLHNGAIVRYITNINFGGTGSTNAIYFLVDPDGEVTDGGTTNGPGRSVEFWLYYSGRLTTRGGFDAPSCTNLGCQNPISNLDPPWFGWD